MSVRDYGDFNNFPICNGQHGFELKPGILQVPTGKSCKESDQKSKGPFKIAPQTEEQEELLYALSRMSYMTIVTGDAGSGKTLFGTGFGVSALQSGLFKHFVITRPMVQAGEEMPPLPGGEIQKMAPILMPVFEKLIELGHTHLMHCLDDVRRDKDTSIGSQVLNNITKPFNVAPIGSMRGRSIDDAFIFLDEGQNTSIEQMKMIASRVGRNSRLYICGDLTQIDTKYDNAQNGLKWLLEKVAKNTSCKQPLKEGSMHVADFFDNPKADFNNDEINVVDLGRSSSQRSAGVNRILSV